MINEDNLDNALLQAPVFKDAYQKSIADSFKTARVVHIDDAYAGVIFSDQHRGDGGVADDFKKGNKETYKDALNYYRLANLILAGDIEELAKFKLDKVLSAHADIYPIEAAFHKAGRLTKLDGNHECYLQGQNYDKLKVLFPDLKVENAIVLKYKDMGYIHILHGHQGGVNDGIFAKVGNYLIRKIVLPVQRTLKFQRATPATDMQLRTETENILVHTVEAMHKVIMIAGHTHNLINSANVPKPAYYNTGCGIYAGGRLSCIEIINGKLNTVEWIGNNRFQVSSSKLENLFDRL